MIRFLSVPMVIITFAAVLGAQEQRVAIVQSWTGRITSEAGAANGPGKAGEMHSRALRHESAGRI